MICPMYQNLKVYLLLMILIYCESNTIDHVVKRANSELRKVKKWLDANKLSMNINKTNHIIFHSPQKPIPPHTSSKVPVI